MRRCHDCGKPWTEKGQPEISATCPHCYAFMHCCMNCRFFDAYAHNKCRIPTTEWVADREKNNFCDEFEFKDDSDSTTKKSSVDTQQSAKAQWDALWAKSSKGKG